MASTPTLFTPGSAGRSGCRDPWATRLRTSTLTAWLAAATTGAVRSVATMVLCSGAIGKQREMLIWGDRLLNAKALGHSEWEASTNGTERATELIPKDIIICDWHYGKRQNYPSVPFLLGKGFRVWPAGWQPLEAAIAFSDFARAQSDPRLLGYLCTTWGKTSISAAATWPPLVQPLEKWRIGR